MNFEELLTLSFRAIIGNKLRSVLTTLGIVIGVFAIIVLVSIGSGLQSYINDQITSLGANILDVMPGSSGFGGGPFQSVNKLTVQIGKKVQNRLIATADVSPMTESMANFKYKNVIDKGAYIIGTTSN